MPSDTNHSTEYSEKYLHVKQKAVERAQKRGETGTRVAVPRTQRLPSGQYLTDKFPVLDLGVQPIFLPDKFRLTIDGAVKHPVSLSLNDLTALPGIELTADFHCVTRWSRLDNVWTGILATTIRELVQPRPEATHVLQHGMEGYTTNLTVADFFTADVMLAYKHDGAFLPPEHGAPLRVITPQLYAWKGAKFLTGLEFLPQDQIGYWEARGYHNHGDPWSEERFWEE